MGSKALPLIDNGVYHSLPQFPADVTGLQAIITGANGISGFGTLRCLLEHPERWSKIYLISRRELPPELLKLLPSDAKSYIQHISIDLQTDSEDIAKKLAGAQADYVFYYAYLQPRPEEGSTVWSTRSKRYQCDACGDPGDQRKSTKRLRRHPSVRASQRPDKCSAKSRKGELSRDSDEYVRGRKASVFCSAL